MNKKYVYSIVYGATSSELSDRVNNCYLKFGWELQGGICALYESDSGRTFLYQAVKNELRKGLSDEILSENLTIKEDE